MTKRLLPLLGLLLGLIVSATSQKLPSELHFSEDRHFLFTGGNEYSGLYDEAEVKEIRIYFTQANYWTLLTQNYNSKTDLVASLKYNGETFDSVGVRFKGQTSYAMGGSSQKKSFNITLDAFVDQKIEGYETLNLNNSFEDASFMREVFYYHYLRNHAPAAKANFVHLYINDTDWGIYQNVQQQNKEFLKEWWMSNDGTNWRADVPGGTFGGGGGPGGGPSWGDGTAALNYLGEDSTTYQKYYTLKSTESSQAWQDLMTACRLLKETPIASLPSTLAPYFDLDRILWHLAGEVLFSDDDSYIHKGKMDYYLYRDAETGRISTYDYDGNSVMKTNFATWSPFYNENKVNYPLMNRLLANPELRQRYLAHLRVLINEYFDETASSALIDKYAAMINDAVQADPKKRTTYAQFVSEKQTLKNFIRNRKASLLSNAEVKAIGPEISEVAYFTTAAWQAPKPGEEVVVTAKVTHNAGLKEVRLFYGLGLTGLFQWVEMNDQGQDGDMQGGDGIYSGRIPAQDVGTYVRFYIEAAANDAPGSVSYYPAGAEHDVLVYQVEAALSLASDMVINEFMASNETGPKDERDQFEDWIELYNKSSQSINLSGYYLSDNPANVKKWTFPEGTSIAANGYLIVWCDEDQMQGPLHSSFNLAASGETIILSDASAAIVDSFTYGQVTKDLSMARKPNGTGNFAEGSHTFNANNNTTAANEEVDVKLTSVYPIPADQFMVIEGAETQPIRILNAFGQVQYRGNADALQVISTADWAEGIYILDTGMSSTKLVVVH
ncbi:MAG: CotH kinase family protein [Saprospiraceae bacterium]|nr:CotH kinase family protein [Saprospiraceae bacterium]